MIELNLLPEELKRKKRRIELPEIPLIPIAIGLIGVLVIIQFLLGGLVFWSKKQLAVLDKDWQELAPKRAELDELKKKISATNNEIRVIEELMEKGLDWSRLLNELSNSLTPNIWFTELMYAERTEERMPEPPKDSTRIEGTRAKPKKYKMRSLTVSGCASGRGEEATTYVARFIRALKDNGNFFEDFDDIELMTIRKDSVAGEDVMNFILVCRFKPEEI